MLLFTYFSIWKKITVMGGEKIPDLLIFSNLFFEEMFCILFSVRDCFKLGSDIRELRKDICKIIKAHTVRIGYVSFTFQAIFEFFWNLKIMCISSSTFSYSITSQYLLPKWDINDEGLLKMSILAKLEVGKDRFASCQLETPWWNLKVPVNGQVVRRGRT